MAKLYICLKCHKIYDGDYIIKGNSPYHAMCPNARCESRIHEIDEIMIPTIFLLNDKGYKTEFCCSAHHYKRIKDLYIRFDENAIDYIKTGIEYGLLPALPSEFCIDAGSIRLKQEIYYDELSKNHNKLNDMQIIVRIVELDAKLYEWCLKLPNLNNKEED